MCGIFGSISNNALHDTYVGLKRLEYRGYDSFGYIALKDGGADICRRIGSVDETVFASNRQYNAVLGHVRWATNGEVTIDNTHPQRSEDSYVIHNGVIENAPSHMLDTRWLANLLELEGDVVNAYNKIEGDNTFVYVNSKNGKIWCAAKGKRRLFLTPKGYVSSDLNALSGFDEKAWALENNYCILTQKDFSSEGLGVDIPAPRQAADYSGHRMLSEIKEQISFQGQEHPLKIKDGVDILATGSSLHAGMFGAYALEKRGILTRCLHASQAPYYQLRGNVLAISQSGETKDIIGAAPEHFICMTNTPHSMLYDMSDKNILLDVGPEHAVAATKTFTMSCMKLSEPIASMTTQIKDLIDRGDEIQRIARRMMGYDHFLFLGDGQNYPIALEGALKFKEVAYVHAEGMPASEMKHGPIALVDYKVPSLFIVTGGLSPEILTNMQEIKSRKGFVVAITHDAIKREVEKNADIVFSCKDTGEQFSQSLVLNVVLQLLSYYIAVERGINPDRPRNLAKCVTV
jgi:glucosamine--fructose-6-phosphate aminotransferase (isomerizing)